MKTRSLVEKLSNYLGKQLPRGGEYEGGEEGLLVDMSPGGEIKLMMLMRMTRRRRNRIAMTIELFNILDGTRELKTRMQSNGDNRENGTSPIVFFHWPDSMVCSGGVIDF